MQITQLNILPLLLRIICAHIRELACIRRGLALRREQTDGAYANANYRALRASGGRFTASCDQCIRAAFQGRWQEGEAMTRSPGQF